MPTLDQDERVFWGPEFTTPVSLCRHDGTGRVETVGIPEDAVTEENLTGRASHHALQPQVTVPTADAGEFTEGDKVIIGGKEKTIVDRLSDGTQTTFLLTE
ncbi:head-tail joining protein [Roseibacillus ishigakijimensis]|uniref:Uncharacterized protein n=1 Tax=Roseibacillus ishigakijimensis TaxID=454146 RepID=A0A934RV34_9BACT|nr:hypothetical protein [Roseibacillus ishigakijimensis]MBK1835011.1 hypothetical protein [Roseibacillus ishigakijimensis]